MPENIHDNTSTKKQNDTYMVDPLDPQAKPYSTSQKAANVAHKGRTRLYLKGVCPNEGQVFEGHEVDALLAEGWVDEPYVHPNCPDKVKVAEPAKAPEPSPERDVLMAEAKQMGLKPHPRTGVDKLRTMIAEISD